MCECEKKINEKLAKLNLRLSIDLVIGENRILTRIPLETVFIDESQKKRGEKPNHIFPIYCPFCGEKYPDLNSNDENAEAGMKTANSIEEENNE